MTALDGFTLLIGGIAVTMDNQIVGGVGVSGAASDSWMKYKSDGSLYFTDPRFGLPKFFDNPRKELPYSGVFRVSPDGKQVQLVSTELKGPNGLAS